jgi:hypothetical protein
MNSKDKQNNKKTTKKNISNGNLNNKNSERIKAYAMRRFLNPTESKKQSALTCNYSNSTHTTNIEATQTFKNAIQELKSLATQCKCSPEDQLTFFQKMRDAKKHSPTSRIESGKEINRMLGYQAPTQVEVEQTSTQNVAVILGMIRGNAGVNLGDLIRHARDKNNITDATTVGLDDD